MARVSKSQLIREWLEEDPSRMDVEGAAKKCSKKFKCTNGVYYAARRQVLGNPVDKEKQFEDCVVLNNNMSRLKVDISAIEGMGLDRVKKILDLLT